MESKKSYLFVTIEGGGNIPPVLGLARRLKERGHRVRVLTEPCLEETVNAYGLEYTPFQQYFTRTDRKEDFIRDWNKKSPFSDPAIENVVLGPAKVTVEETLRALDETPTDVLVADILLPAALIAAEARGIHRTIAFHMPEYLPGPNRPPGMMGLKPGKGVWGSLRDRLLAKLFQKTFNQYKASINEIRASLGLEPVRNVSQIVEDADLRLIQTLRSFDFPIEPAPANVRYAGPVLDDPDWAEAWRSPWDATDQRPLVVVSLSSTFQNQGDVIQHCLEALGSLKVRGLVTLGLAMEDAKLEVPDNVVVVKSAPHSEVFPQADLVITHAGHGTIMRALSHGLPLICLPMGRDQHDNALKVADRGCGIKLSAKAKPAKIASAVSRVLEEETFSKQADIFQQEIRQEAEKDTAIRALEKLGKESFSLY